ncbi:MAG: hypothetical protein QF473_39520, partial [Planctomycetota bacterium]|nr:hypothetical protein [Planctomycetota bacterium]
HLVEGAPTLHVSEFVIEKLDLPVVMGQTFKITGSHISTHPSLLPNPPRFDIETESKVAGFKLNLKELSDPGEANNLDLNWNGLKIDDLIKDLSFADKLPFSGGTIDLQAAGDWKFNDKLSIPAEVTIKQAKIQVPKLGEMTLEEFPLKFEVTGSLQSPRVRFDKTQLTEVIKEQGAKMLKAKLAQAGEEFVDKTVDKAAEKVNEVTGKIQDKIGDKLEGETGKKITGKLGAVLGEDKTKKLTDTIGGKLGDKETDKIKDKGKGLIKGLLGSEKKEEQPEPKKETPEKDSEEKKSEEKEKPEEEKKPEEKKKQNPKDLIKGLFGK